MNPMKYVLAAAAFALGAGGVQAQEVKIAVVGPITGQYAAFGEQMKRGAEMAVAEINAAGGVMGRKLALSVGDDACDPKQAVAVANKMVTDKVAFVAGHFCSSSSIPASAVYRDGNILQISPASTNPQLTEQGIKTVFRTCGRDDAQGVVVGEFLAKNYKGKNVAILHDKSTYGKGVADETKKAMNKGGLKEKMYEAYTQGDKDFSALISKMKQAQIDAIVLGGYHTEGGLLIRQAREQGLKAQLIGFDALVTDEFGQIAGPASDAVVMTFPPDPSKVAKNKDLVAKFQAEGYNPEGYTLFTYAAVKVWAEAAKKANATDAPKVAAALRQGKYDSPVGTLEFDEKGDVKNAEYVFYEWKGGKYAQK